MNFDKILDKAVQVVGEDKAEEIMKKVEKIMEASKDANGNVNAYLDTLKEALKEVHPLLEAFMNEGGNDVIADVAKDLYDKVANMDKSLFAFADMLPMFFDRDEIKTAIEDGLSQFTNKLTPEMLESGLAQQSVQKNPMLELSDERLAELTKASDAIIPKAFFKFGSQLGGTEGLSIEERIKKLRVQAEAGNNKTPAEKAKAIYDLIQNLPVDDVLDLVEGAIEKISSESVGTLHEEFTKRVKATDFVSLGQNAAALALEFTQSADSGKNTRAQLLGAQFAHILQSIEDSVIAAGLTSNDPDLGKNIRAMFVQDTADQQAQLPAPN